MKLRTNFAKLVVSIDFKGKLKYYRILQEIGVCEIRHVLSALLSSNSVNWRGAVGDCPVRKVPRRITRGVCCDPFRIESLENHGPEVFACARPPANSCNPFRIR